MSDNSNKKMIDHQPILLHTVKDKIATLTLNRPSQYNCLSEELLSELLTQLKIISKNSNIRVVVIQGNGVAFCAGHDLKQMRRNPSKIYYQNLFKKCSEFMVTITELPQPVIAKVHGVATAAGCQLVATCDLAIGSESSAYAASGINLGLFCSTPSVAISRNISKKKSAEMLFTGELVTGKEAVSMGLINSCVADDALEDATALMAAKIAKKPSVAVSIGKKMFNRQIGMNLSEAYEYAAEVMACNMMEADTVEGIDAFIQKRKPNW